MYFRVCLKAKHLHEIPNRLLVTERLSSTSIDFKCNKQLCILRRLLQWLLPNKMFSWSLAPFSFDVNSLAVQSSSTVVNATKTSTSDCATPRASFLKSANQTL